MFLSLLPFFSDGIDENNNDQEHKHRPSKHSKKEQDTLGPLRKTILLINLFLTLSIHLICAISDKLKHRKKKRAKPRKTIKAIAWLIHLDWQSIH